MRAENWNRDDLVLAFNLYCRTPFGKIHNRNPEVIALANLINRSPSSVSWKLANFARLDPSLASRNIRGATHGSKGEKEIWAEFEQDWDRLTYESELLRIQRLGLERELSDDAFPEGKAKDTLIKARVNQGFFRSSILAAYGSACCVTGIQVSELLCASHIVPWSVDVPNRTNPRNGLCLNALHDRAFDRGLISVSTEFKVVISPRLKERRDSGVHQHLLSYESKIRGCSS